MDERKQAGIEGKVLILDDDPEQRFRYSYHLRNGGYHPIEAGNVDEAKEYLLTHLPRICIVDYRMPNKKSTEPFCRYVKENMPHIPIIMISGKDRDKTLFDLFFMKPIDKAGLLRLVKEATERKRNSE